MKAIRIFYLPMIYSKNKEALLAKRAGAYRGEKRRKEIARQKKQEEKRQRRFQKEDVPPPEGEKADQEEPKTTDP